MKGGFKLKGKYRFKKKNTETGEVSVGPWIENLIMLDDDIGLNLILQRMANVLTYDIIITSAEIGTGNTAPADTDTALATPVLTAIPVTLQAVSTDNIVLTFFINSGSLANGTYKEFGLRCGTQMFARSIISPNYVKGTNEDTTVEYTITAMN